MPGSLTCNLSERNGTSSCSSQKTIKVAIDGSKHLFVGLTHSLDHNKENLPLERGVVQPFFDALARSLHMHAHIKLHLLLPLLAVF